MRHKSIKGLANFIADIRGCPSREAERIRVEKELAKIRSRLAGNKNLSGYEQKKNVWKLVYCYMLGYDVNLGQIEAVNLVSSQKYSEKATGYIACSLLLAGNPEVLSLVINLVKRDLQSRSHPTASLALNFLANAATDEMIDILYHDVAQLTLSHVTLALQTKAYLVLLRFARQRPDLFTTIEPWVAKAIQAFQRVTETAFLMGVVSFILGILELCPRQSPPSSLLMPVINLLWRTAFSECPDIPHYSGVPVPWLQIKLLRLLQFYSGVSHPTGSLEKISEILRKILSRPLLLPAPTFNGTRTKRKSRISQERQSRSNIEHAIFFEAVNVLLDYNTSLDVSLKRVATMTLSTTGSVRDCNIRYLRLEVLSRLAVDLDVVRTLYPQTKQILTQIYEPDDSLRRQAVNLLFVICNKETWQPIVDELLLCLRKSPETQFREELVLKIATLVEKHAPNLTWYIDTVFTMIEYCADAVCEEVWHRTVQMVTGCDHAEESLQIYAARKAYDGLADPYANETLVRLASYLVGEFGHLIVDEAPGKQQFATLQRHLPRVDSGTKAVILTALAKLCNVEESVEDEVLDVFAEYAVSGDMEVQQRALEFQALCQLDHTLVEDILACMPSYPPEKARESPLLQRLRNYTSKRAVPRALLEDAARTEGLLLKPSSVGQTLNSGQQPLERATDTSHDDELESSSLSPSRSSVCSADNDAIRASIDSQNVSNTENSASERSSIASATCRSRSSSEDSFSSGPSDRSPRQTLAQQVTRLPDPSDVSGLWARLCLLPEGLLLSTSPLRVVVKQQYKNGIGRVLAVWINDAPEPLQLRRITVESPRELEVRVVYDPTADGSGTLATRGVAKHAMELCLLQPFLTSPRYMCYGTLTQSGKPFMVETALPVRLTSFISPAPMHPDKLMESWNRQPPLLGGQDVEFSGRLVPSLAASQSLLEAHLVDGFHLHLVKKNDIIYCSGMLTFHKHSQIPCLVRILVGSLQHDEIHLTVRTPQPMVTRTLSDIIASYLMISQPYKSSTPVSATRTPLSYGQFTHTPHVSGGTSLLSTPSYPTAKATEKILNRSHTTSATTTPFPPTFPL